MGLTDSIRVGASGAASAYEVERSLRFGDDDTRLRIGQSSGNQQIFTFSVWLKRSKISSGTNTISSATFNVGGQFGFYFLSDDKLQVREYNGQSNSETIDIRTSRLFRDISSWFHLVVAIDTTQGTSTNRAKVYVNGEQVTDFSTTSFPSQNQNFMVNSNFDNQRFHIGVENYAGTTNEFQGYIAEYNFIDGQQLAPSNFGETNAITGQWNPKKYTGSYGTNGFYLNFSDNSGTTATTLGKDSSGNGNNFTPNNFNVTANSVENDSVLDTPTNNWCTLNPLTGGWTEGGSIPLADGMLHADNPNSGDKSVHATFTLKAGKKYYIEGVYLEPSGGGSQCKWALSTLGRNNGMPKKPASTGSFGIDWRGGAGTTQSIDESSQDNIGSRPASGTVIGVAIDLVNGKFYAHQGNTYYNSGNPDNGTGAIVTGIPTGVDYFFTTSVDSGGPNFSEFKINFGQQGFQHQPSTFTDLLNSQSLADPSIALPENHFETLLYTGNGGTNTISGLEFQPDWVWLKKRSGTTNHLIFDSVRGTNKSLNSNGTGGQDTSSTNKLTSFNSDGFTLGSNASGNNNGDTYVAWNWNAGGSTVTNTTGSISVQLRANPTAGFSIATWTGNGSNGATIGHGLGVTPNFCLIKRTNTGGNNWIAGSFDLELARELNTTNQFDAGDYDAFFPSQPSSTVVTLSTNDNCNANSSTYVGYFFSSVSGYSKISTYRGNGSAVGSFVFTGFRPAWVMTKIIDTMNENWTISDNKRSPVNPVNLFLRPDESTQDTSGAATMDFTANGFKLRNSDDKTNRNGAIFFYMAFAESPFKNSRAR